jgi:rubrerythrin
MNKVAQCLGKEPLTREWARKLADRLNKRKKRAIALGPYRCKYCGHWHIGNERK